MLTPATCPLWEDDSTEHKAPQCVAAARGVWLRACMESKSHTPDCKAFRSWHEGMFRSVVPLPYYAGNFRQHDLNRICLGTDVAVGGVGAASFRRVSQLMAQLETELHDHLVGIDLSWSQLAGPEKLRRVATVVGAAIGRFIQIHPFINGNGRTSRLLWAALLARMGLPVDMAVVRRPAGPYASAMAAAMTGNLAPAVLMVFSGIAKMQPPATPPVRSTP